MDLFFKNYSMKKLLSILLLFILSASSLFAYNPTVKDKKLLNSVYRKIDSINNKQPSKLEKLYKKIEIIKDKNLKERISYIINELYSYIWEKLNDNDDTFKESWVINNYTVSKVIDWDTVKLKNSNWEIKSVRLIWIDSPESYKTRYWYIECYWDEAKTYLKWLIEWKIVELEYDNTQWKTDKYGRTLGYINYNWENINWKMIKQGYAWEYTYSKKYNYSDTFKKNQEYADKHSKWLWSSSTCNWERKEVKKEEEIIKTNETYSCWTKRYCTNMSTCAEARYYLNTCWLNRLDRDWDWIPCESLCNLKN